MASRRSVLVGLGGLVAGGGALIGTGAFTTVEAQRTVNVETAGDASAFLGLEPADRDGSGNNQYVEQSDDTVTITLENPGSNNTTGANATGLNENARTVFRNLVTVANNGTQDVTSLELEFIDDGNLPSNISESKLGDIFSFTVSPSGNGNNSNQSTIDNGDDAISDSYITSDLTPGNSFNFGIEINLLDSGITEIPSDSSFTLQITAGSQNSNNN